MQPDVIFIGAGPIGLLAAIQLKIEFSQANILMFDKYEVPTRNHAMYIDKDSFAGMNGNNGFAELLEKIGHKMIISDLEILLRKFALDIGISIQFQTITDFKTLENQYPNTQCFIGSGGLRGIIHSQLFNNENQINMPLQHAIEVKYKVEGKARKLDLFPELPSALVMNKYPVSEYIGHQKDEETPISLRIFVNKSAFNDVQQFTFKNPAKLSDLDEDTKLAQTIKNYMNYRKEHTKEVLKPETLKIVPITLAIYASKTFAKLENEKTIFICGEEAFACPFYRSFNDNACMVPFLVKAIKASLLKEKILTQTYSHSSMITFPSKTKGQKEPYTYYTDAFQNLIDKEKKVISVLNLGVNTMYYSAQSSHVSYDFSSQSIETTSNFKNCTIV